MNRITKYVITDILRNRILLAYGLLLAAFSWTALSLEDNSAKGLLTILNLMLLMVPLMSVLFSTIYIYNSAEFIELLVSQPIRRTQIWGSLFSGLGSSLGFVFLLGMGLPLLLYAPGILGLMMCGTGVLITLIFCAIGFFAAVFSRDKARGIGIAILIWLFYALLFDGLLLFLIFQFSEYPIEKFMIGVAVLSPIDLARILIILQLDISVLMGFTGAVFKDFFGTKVGLAISFGMLLVWTLAPYFISRHKFKTKDL